VCPVALTGAVYDKVSIVLYVLLYYLLKEFLILV